MLDIRFADRMHGWAVGYNGFNALIMGTVDGGDHWTTEYSGSEITGQFDLVRFWDSSHGWVLANDAVMKTDNGGESWNLMHFYPGSKFNDIELVGPADFWIAGAWGHLIHSPNGFDWHEVVLTASLSENFIGWVKFVSKETGWAWGVKGDIVMTHDGGHTWIQEVSPLKIKPEFEDTTSTGASDGSKLFISVFPGRLMSRSIK
jgi:photosystem II stability/assembly factor-like uncharacterized protein